MSSAANIQVSWRLHGGFLIANIAMRPAGWRCLAHEETHDAFQGRNAHRQRRHHRRSAVRRRSRRACFCCLQRWHAELPAGGRRAKEGARPTQRCRDQWPMCRTGRVLRRRHTRQRRRTLGSRRETTTKPFISKTRSPWRAQP